MKVGWRAAALMLAATFAVLPALAADEAPEPPAGRDQGVDPAAQPGGRRQAKPVDPVSGIEGSPDAWSVSRSSAGCYLMSPYRRGSTRLAIGQHPASGTGLFAINLMMSLPMNASVPVVIEADGQEFAKGAQLIGANLLFVPLGKAEIEAGLRALRQTGALWVVVQGTSIVHGGQAVRDAAAQYDKICTNGAPLPPPPAQAQAQAQAHG